MRKMMALVAAASGMLFVAGCCPRTLVLGLQLMRLFGGLGGAGGDTTAQ